MEDNSRKGRWKKANKEKNNAHAAVHRALKKGILKKEPCFCGEVKVEAHHTNYEKPLEVIFLCTKHHKDVHNGKIKIEGGQFYDAQQAGNNNICMQ